MKWFQRNFHLKFSYIFFFWGPIKYHLSNSFYNPSFILGHKDLIINNKISITLKATDNSLKLKITWLIFTPPHYPRLRDNSQLISIFKWLSNCKFAHNYHNHLPGKQLPTISFASAYYYSFIAIFLTRCIEFILSQPAVQIIVHMLQ